MTQFHAAGFFVLMVLAWLTSPVPVFACATPPVQQGQLDLSCLEPHQSMQLEGDWQLTFTGAYSEYQFTGFAAVPGTWSSLPGNPDFRGSGSYRLSISQAGPDTPLSLSLPSLWAARQVTVIHPDGRRETLLQAGDIDDPANLWRAPALSHLIALPRLAAGTVLEIQLGAYETRFAGLWRPPTIGTTTALQYSRQLKKAAAVATATALVLFSLVIMALLRIRLEIAGSGTLACMAIFLALRQLSDAGIVYDLFPTLSVGVEAWLSWTSYLLGVAAGFYYLLARYRDGILQWAVKLPLLMSGLGLVLLFTSDLATLQRFGTIHHPMMMAMALLCFISLANKLDPRKIDSLMTMSGFCAIFIAFAFDLTDFYYLNDSFAIPMISLAWLLFIGGQIFLLSQRYFKVWHTNVQLNQELSELNQSLEKRIQARTQELNIKNQQLEVLSRTDALTGLANRRVLQEFVTHEFARLKRQPAPLSVALLDVDFFKRVNDQYGHTVGDEVLVAVARLLARSVREVDLVARWGGEEFCIIFSGIDLQQTFGVMERIRQTLADTPIATSTGQPITVTCSAGIACTQCPLPFERLMEQVDSALYRAKREGRNQTQLSHVTEPAPG